MIIFLLWLYFFYDIIYRRMTLSISDIKINYTLQNKIIRMVTPFTLEFWLALFLLYCFYLLNRYIIYNKWVNVIYIIMCLFILFY